MDAATLDDVIRRLLEARGGRTARPAQLTDPEIRRLCAAAKDVFLSQPNLLELEAPIKVCGKEDLLRAPLLFYPSISLARFIVPSLGVPVV